jgi:flagellar biosynthesis/type III secretory pathway ATPase
MTKSEKFLVGWTIRFLLALMVPMVGSFFVQTAAREEVEASLKSPSVSPEARQVVEEVLHSTIRVIDQFLVCVGFPMYIVVAGSLVWITVKLDTLLRSPGGADGQPEHPGVGRGI